MNDPRRGKGKTMGGRGGKRGKEAEVGVEVGRGGKEEGKQRESGEEVGEEEEATYRRVSSMKHPY